MRAGRSLSLRKSVKCSFAALATPDTLAGGSEPDAVAEVEEHAVQSTTVENTQVTASSTEAVAGNDVNEALLSALSALDEKKRRHRVAFRSRVS
jgi:hypothetical protein